MQLRRIGCRTQGVGIPEYGPEMSEEMAREEGDDVQESREEDREAGRVWRMSQNAGFFVTKCRFTRRIATLRSGQPFELTVRLPRSRPCPAAS